MSSPLEQMKPQEDKTRRDFAAAAPMTDRRKQQAAPSLVQGAFPAPRPEGARGYGNTPAAPDAQAIKRVEEAREAEAKRTTFKPHELHRRREADQAKPAPANEQQAGKPLSPLDKSRARNNTPEEKAKRIADEFAKANRPDRGDDFSL